MDPGPFARRRQRLRAALVESELDALVVTRLVNVRYLCGFTGTNATLLVGSSGGDLLATDGRYAHQARAEAGGLPLEVTREDAWLADRLPPGTRVGLEGRGVTWGRLAALEGILDARTLVRTTRMVEGLRARKDDIELAALRRAGAVTAAAVREVPSWLAPGLTERQVARRLLDAFWHHGADDRAFEPIVASGPNTARPHHRPTDRVLAPGDLVQLDVGALVDGYGADMSRVFALGSVAADLSAIHQIVAEAHAAGLATVHDGASAGEVDAACRGVINAAGHGEDFVHPSGHGLGLEIHEEPVLRDGSAARLRSRMAVTVEPGIYVPGLGGIRIEDVAVVTDTGADVLTRAPTELQVV